MSGRSKSEVKRSFETMSPLRGHSMNQRNLNESFQRATRHAPSKKVLRSYRRVQREAEAVAQRKERIAAAIKDATRRELQYGFDGIDLEVRGAGLRYISGSRERR